MTAMVNESRIIAGVVLAAMLVAGVGLLWRMLSFWRSWHRVTQQVSAAATPKASVRRRLFSKRDPLDVATLIRRVAASLQAGATLSQAWAHTNRPTNMTSDGVPLWLKQAATRPTWKLWWARRRGKTSYGITISEVLGRNRSEAVLDRRAAHNVCVACRFTQASGAPLADILDDVAAGMDQQAEVDQARKVARAGPTMSARVLAFLPLLGVGLAEAMGAKPFELFTDGGVGTTCLVVGVVFEVAGVGMTWAMIRAASKLPEGPNVALWCDLSRMGVASGASIPDVVDRLGQAAEYPPLRHLSRCLRFGVPWAKAWEQCLGEAASAELEPVGSPLQSAWEQGLSPEVLLASAAKSLRQSLLAQARQSAEVLAVRLVIPVASCLLPAFVFLGVIPLLVRFLGASLGGLT